MTEEREPMEMKEEKEGKEWRGDDWGWGGSRSWIIGLVLILFGGLWLAESFVDLDFINGGNWWVIFVFIFGIQMIANGWERYRRRGRWGSSIVWGILLLAFGFSQLFALAWDYLWPALLIVGGLALLISAMRR